MKSLWVCWIFGTSSMLAGIGYTVSLYMGITSLGWSINGIALLLIYLPTFVCFGLAVYHYSEWTKMYIKKKGYSFIDKY